jgi:hypothetical protein
LQPVIDSSATGGSQAFIFLDLLMIDAAFGASQLSLSLPIKSILHNELFRVLLSFCFYLI